MDGFGYAKRVLPETLSVLQNLTRDTRHARTGGVFLRRGILADGALVARRRYLWRPWQAP